MCLGFTSDIHSSSRGIALNWRMLWCDLYIQWPKNTYLIHELLWKPYKHPKLTRLWEVGKTVIVKHVDLLLVRVMVRCEAYCRDLDTFQYCGGLIFPSSYVAV